MWLDEAPVVRVHGPNPDTGRMVLSIDLLLTVYAQADVLRGTLVAALEQLDALAVEP